MLEEERIEITIQPADEKGPYTPPKSGKGYEVHETGKVDEDLRNAYRPRESA